MSTDGEMSEIDRVADRVGELLDARGAAVAVAESLTGGMIVSALARVDQA